MSRSGATRRFSSKPAKLIFPMPTGMTGQTIGPPAITADGQRFLFIAPQRASSAPAPFTVVMNWQAGFKN